MPKTTPQAANEQAANEQAANEQATNEQAANEQAKLIATQEELAKAQVSIEEAATLIAGLRDENATLREQLAAAGTAALAQIDDDALHGLWIAAGGHASGFLAAKRFAESLR